MHAPSVMRSPPISSVAPHSGSPGDQTIQLNSKGIQTRARARAPRQAGGERASRRAGPGDRASADRRTRRAVEPRQGEEQSGRTAEEDSPFSTASNRNARARATLQSKPPRSAVAGSKQHPPCAVEARSRSSRGLGRYRTSPTGSSRQNRRGAHLRRGARSFSS